LKTKLYKLYRSNLVTWSPVKMFKLDNLNHYLLKLKFQLVKFEQICNYLTPCTTKRTYVHVQDNDVIGSYDQNDMFRKAFIDAYFLGVSNPKGCVHSQPHKHSYLKRYKETRIFHFVFSFSLTSSFW
jgi:hypothetical protein